MFALETDVQGFSPLILTVCVVRDWTKEDLPDPVRPMSNITGGPCQVLGIGGPI